MLACLTFVFVNLLQFTIAMYIQSNMSAHIVERSHQSRRKSHLSDEQALNGYLMQKNRERFRVIRQLRTLNGRNKSANFKKTELVKYLAVSKIPGRDNAASETNERLPFVLNRPGEPNHKAFLSNDEHYRMAGERLLSFSESNRTTDYDRVLRERVERLVKYNSSSSSSSDSEDSEESWFQKAKHDDEVKDLIRKFDGVSRVVLLFIFIGFNLFYWPYMIINSSLK